MKICPKCGAENSNNNNYCQRCGTTLSKDVNAERNAISTMTILAGILAIVLVAGGTTLLIRSQSKNSNASDNTVVSEAELEPTQESELTQESEPETKSNPIPDNVNIPKGAVTFEDHSYYIFDNNCSSWEEAGAYCKSRGGYLAVINSKQEDDFLFEFMLDSGRNEVYFGFSDAGSEGNWRWVDNKSSSYLNWGINDDGEIEPNKDAMDENYAEYDVSLISGRWNDCGFGRDTSAYICEWDYVMP